MIRAPSGESWAVVPDLPAGIPPGPSEESSATGESLLEVFPTLSRRVDAMDTPESETEPTATEMETEEPAFVGGASTPAAEVLEMLRRGETVANTRVVGLKLRGDFPLPVRFRNVTLVQPRIDRANFADDVAFEHCTLDRPCFTKKSTFEKGLCLSESTLVRAAIRGATVKGPFRCDNLRTRGRFLVEGARFEGGVRFWSAQFQGWAEFKACEFVGEADFRSVHAGEGFVLTRCTFRANALFRGATVQKKFEADGTRFEALLDLSKAKLHDFVYLEAIEQGAVSGSPSPTPWPSASWSAPSNSSAGWRARRRATTRRRCRNTAC